MDLAEALLGVAASFGPAGSLVLQKKGWNVTAATAPCAPCLALCWSRHAELPQTCQ